MAPRAEPEVVDAAEADAAFRAEVLALCERGYEEPLAHLFQPMRPVAFVVIRRAGRLVAHAMWVDRWLERGGARPRRTAYVEFVVTDPLHRGEGLATAVLERLLEEIRGRGYTLSALSPATYRIYERLGWRLWKGPLSARHPDGRQVDTPEEEVMVLDEDGDWMSARTDPLSIEWREGEVW